MISRNPARNRGFVVFTALVALMILMIVAALFLQYGIHGLRREHMQALGAQCDQIEAGLRDLSRRNPGLASGEMREVSIASLLPPGAEGTAWLGGTTSANEPTCMKCRIVLELGADRIDRNVEWSIAGKNDQSPGGSE